MLTFNDILRREKLDPKRVQLVRHHDTRWGRARPTPYDLWRANDGTLELYQRIQGKKRFKVGGLLATFVVTRTKETVFVGLYSVDGVGTVPPNTKDPIAQDDEDVSGKNFYNLHPDERMAEYVGHLTIHWGTGFLQWVQRADRQDKVIAELKYVLHEPPFPGFREFCWDIGDIEGIPVSWQSVLKAVKGVYALVCKETGKQYVGSAKGEESLWGRFVEYARSGHGGNLELKQRGKKPYQVTILEVVNSDIGIEQIEEAWKSKLMSVEFGLNRRTGAGAKAQSLSHSAGAS